ncbi:acyl carrier protein [Ruegeria sp. R13_0]|uniref:acyl carrier protein n=1 Tax=Ruegeria sp. R13_0 TaxID=2821099 RepID=UPI001ADA2688|nr:phosphopantetheine-binding protein [Ruegeria sp. R13_0]MBO9436779.1 acyl carrier protein [Ruegeria sp. R13_0]
MALTQDTLISYLITSIEPDDAIEPETELFSSGLLDSVLMMNLIMFLEEQSGIQVRPEDVTLENFDTPARIIQYTEGAS